MQNNAKKAAPSETEGKRGRKEEEDDDDDERKERTQSADSPLFSNCCYHCYHTNHNLILDN